MARIKLKQLQTHWQRLARVLRHEAQTVAASDYVAVSRALGRRNRAKG